jgi:hypothetical protein
MADTSTLRLRIFDGSRQLFSKPTDFLVKIVDGRPSTSGKNFTRCFSNPGPRTVRVLLVARRRPKLNTEGCNALLAAARSGSSTNSGSLFAYRFKS